MGLSTFDVFKQIDSEGLIEVSGERLCALQEVLLRMLGDLDRVCAKHDIPYTLGGGSCLGAVRHHGFIPWDDDLDINMTRDSYRRFIDVYESELKDRYWLHDCGVHPRLRSCLPEASFEGHDGKDEG